MDRSPLALAALLACLLPALAAAADLDGDGLDDALEDALLVRHAPVVLLAPGESARPAGADWLLARSEIEPEREGSPPVLAAAILGTIGTAQRAPARLRPAAGALAGSADPGDWVVYGHAVPAAEGGVLLQYWFLYPMNDGWGLFDHEGDWEHVTVRLDAGLRPVGADYARHENAMPGRWFPWSALRHVGDHPVVLAARGTHASYASPEDVPFWERACPRATPDEATAAGCVTWWTWQGGGVRNLGELPAPRVAFLAWPGRWGATGRFGLESSSAAPHGPAFQAGWCSGAAICPR
jgi:hypothetical protein